MPGARASAPLFWDEVNEDLNLDDYTIKSLPERMAGMKDDPLAPVLSEKPDLVSALGRLASLIDK